MPLASLTLLSLFAASPDGSILQRSACEFPAYEKAEGVGRYATKALYDAAVADKRFACERLTYASDDLPVIAFAYRPVSTATLPLVIVNRGSWVVDKQLPQMVTMFRRLADAGFAVIAPMYRGSEGAPGHDEMGGGDLNDLRNILPLAKNLGSIDLDHVFLYGESRGGVMALMALRDGFPASAAATSGAFTDLSKYLEGDRRAQQLVKTIWPEFTDEIKESRSAIRFAERIKVPVLLMHGGGDQQVPLSQTLDLAARFETLKKPYAIHVFGGENHVITGQRSGRDEQAILWFKKHLK